MSRNPLILYLLGLVFLYSNNLLADVVTVSGRQILVNNSPYVIKGICYNPVPKGSNVRSWESLTEDLALMVEAGINTIRVYTPITDIAVLDEIDAAGIKIIMSIGYNQGGENDILSGTFIDYINTYKTHNAILFWEFGNEYNYHPEWFNNDIENWYLILNSAAEEAQFEDENHPVSTAHGELPDANARLLCHNVDVWGMNVYRWDNPEAIFNEWQSVSTKPMFLSEAGADRYMTAAMNGYDMGENEQAQADATKNILDDVFNSSEICAGVTLFEFTDEWWKAGNNNTHDAGGWAPNSGGVPYDGAPNEEYWGILDIDRNNTMAYEVLKSKYNSIIIGLASSLDVKSCYVYPNPVVDEFTVYGIDHNCIRLEVIDISGVIRYSGHYFSSNSSSFNIAVLPKGFYLVKIIFNDRHELFPIVKM